MADEGHHLGSSPLVATSLGMVSGFPLDYMHLVCLGVMRWLLHLWLKGPLACRLSGENSLWETLEDQKKCASGVCKKAKISEWGRLMESLWIPPVPALYWSCAPYRLPAYGSITALTFVCWSGHTVKQGTAWGVHWLCKWCSFVCSALRKAVWWRTFPTICTTLYTLHKMSRCMGTWIPSVPSNLKISCKN